MNKLLIKDLNRLKNFIKTFNDSRLKLVDKRGNFYSNKHNFFYKLMLSNILDNSPYKNFFINTLYKCESIFPNSSLYTLKKIIENRNLIENIKNRKPNVSDLKLFLNKFIEEDSYNLFFDILNFSGPDSSIYIDSTENIKSIVKKENITEFNIKCHDELSNILFSNNKKSKRDVYFLAYDGFLERDTDLHHLFLESQQNNKKTIVILCRGINSYFMTSLKKMILQTKCPVLLYECPFSNHDPFLFDDICKALDIDSVKIEDNNVIINQVKNKFKLIQEIILEENKISCEIEENIRFKLVSELNEQLKDCKEEFKEHILNRKKRFQNKKVNILISKDKKRLIEDLKFSFFVYNNICKYGIVEVNNEVFPKQLYEISSKFSQRFNEQVKNISYVNQIKKEYSDDSKKISK